MNTKNSKAIAEILTSFLLMVVIFLISACSHVVFPRGQIPVKMDIVGPIETTKEISFVNLFTINIASYYRTTIGICFPGEKCPMPNIRL